MRTRKLSFWRPLVIPAILMGLMVDCAEAADRPNVVIFYADDLGWGETGSGGAKDIPFTSPWLADMTEFR